MREKPWDSERAKQLAGEHWAWFQSLAGHIAMDNFVHGHKHGWEDREKVERKRRRSDGR